MPAICKDNLPLDSFGRSYHHGGPGPSGSKYDISAGIRLKIYWPTTKEFHSGTVTALNPKGMYVFRYDNGAVRKVKLASLVWDFEEASGERNLKKQKTAEDQDEITATEGMSKFSSRTARSSEAEDFDNDCKTDAVGGRMSTSAGSVAEVMQSSYQKDFGIYVPQDTLARDGFMKDTVDQSGFQKDNFEQRVLSGKRRRKHETDELTASTKESTGVSSASDTEAGRKGTLRRVRKPSMVVRDILGGHVMGGGHLETFTLAAANLLVPTAEKETIAATATASTVFSITEQLHVKQKHHPPRSPTTKLKPPTPAPVNSSPARVLGARIQPEEEPSQTTLPQNEKEREEPNLEAVSWAAKAEGDEALESPSLELMVELSPTSSPQVSLQSDDMYVALAEDPSDSGGDEYEDNEASHAQSEVKEEEKADVREGWRGRAGKGKQRRKKGPRRHWPDLEGSHGVRSLAEIYEVTGGELPGFSRKKGKGMWIRPENSKGEYVDFGKSTSANVGNHGEESPLQGARRAGMMEEREGLLDLRVLVVNDGLKTLASMMEREREVVGLPQRGNEENSLGRDKVVGDAGAADDSKSAEEESDDFLAQTLLDLRGDRDAGFLGAQKASDGPHAIRDSIEPALQPTKRPGPGASRASEETLRTQSAKSCPGAGTGRDLNVPTPDNDGRSSAKKEKVMSPTGGVSATLPSAVRDRFKEPEPQPHARLVSDFLRDIPLDNSTPTRGYTPTLADMGERSQVLFAAIANCIPGRQNLENGIASMNNGDGMGAERVGTSKAKLIAGQSLTAGRCTNPGAYPVAFGPETARVERAIVARSLREVNLSLDRSVGTGNTGVNICLPVEGVNQIQSAGLMAEVSPRNGVSSLLDSLATGSDLSAEPTAHVGHRIGRGSIVCRTEWELNSSMVGQAGLGGRADAKGELSERGRAPRGVLHHRALGVVGGQTVVPHTDGAWSEEPQLSSNRPEDIFLARLQSDPRKRAVALLRVLRQGGGLVGWLEFIGLKNHAEYFKKWQITPEMVVGFGREDIKSLGLRVGNRVRLMTAIWDLYQK